MLSAIAVRKARQDTGNNPESPPIDFRPPSPPLPAKLISKRKLKTQGGNSVIKKAKPAIDKRTRYFAAQDAFELEQDLIVVEPESDQDDTDPVPLTEPVASHKVTKPRAWSPSVPLADSSDEGSEEDGSEPDMQEDPVVTRPGPEHTVLSTFQPVDGQNTFYLSPDEARSLGFVRLKETVTLLVLVPADTIAFLGTYALTVIHGSISLSGVTLTASRTSHRVFSPRSSPVPVISHVAADLESAVDPSALTDRLRLLFTREVAIVALQEARTGVDGLGRVCRTFNGVFEPPHWHKSNGEPHLKHSGIYMLTQQNKDVQPFFLPVTWETALSAVVLPKGQDAAEIKPMVGLVRGSKKTGKSTFARTLLNRLLTQYQKIAYLECDLGQSEFTPGGIVALNVIEQPVFGPPFTHPTIPNYAHYIGATSPRASPSHYLAAVQSLLQTYRLDIHTRIDADSPGDDRISDTIPLVVNTMGWTKGLGADLSGQIEDLVEPTHIFEFEAPVFRSGWPAAPVPDLSKNLTMERANEITLYRLEPIPSSLLSSNYSPADHRTLSILSYFHAVFQPPTPSKELQQLSAHSWNTTLPLCAQLPYEVDWSVAFDKVVLTGAGTEDVVSSEIDHVLNGAVVALVNCEPGTLDVDGSTSTSSHTIPYTQGSPVPSPSTSNCYGIALIRGMSPTSSHMHVLTPLPPHYLEKCRVLVKGELELPIWGMLDLCIQGADVREGVAGVEKGKVPYLQWGKGEGLGGERRRVRRNLMRKGQM